MLMLSAKLKSSCMTAIAVAAIAVIRPAASYAGSIAATGSNAAQDESFALPPVTHTAPLGVFK